MSRDKDIPSRDKDIPSRDKDIPSRDKEYVFLYKRSKTFATWINSIEI